MKHSVLQEREREDERIFFLFSFFFSFNGKSLNIINSTEAVVETNFTLFFVVVESTSELNRLEFFFISVNKLKITGLHQHRIRMDIRKEE